MWFNIGFWDVLLFLLFVGILIYARCTWSLGKFKRKGVKNLPTIPLIGNFAASMTRKKHFVDILTDTYNSFPDEKYVGIFQFQRPNLMIKDLDLIKQINIKDFEYFEDHQLFVDPENDPILGKNLLSLSGQKWRDMRATLSPAFTSSKMKNMFLLVEECATRMTKFYLDKTKDDSNQNKEYLEVDMKDSFTRYANDVIATCAFGINVDSLREQNNEFYTMGKKAISFSFFQIIKSIIIILSPRITKIFKLQLFDKKLSNFFRNLVSSQMSHREKNNVIRPDMIHLLMEAKKGSLKHESETGNKDHEFATAEESSIGNRTVRRDWSDDEFTAQVVLFFLAGFDTSSTLLSFLSLELAIQPEIQKKLQDEIDATEKENEKITYNNLQNMKYMDMVVSEALRKWTPGVLTDRCCVKPYTLPPPSPNGKPYTVEKGDGIWMPMYVIHRDPKYYSDPEKFDPERFSDENKSKIKQFTYLPFGLGPRNCIGSRFALMEIKCLLFHMLSKFDFVATPKTCNPIVLDKKVFNMAVEGGFWLGLKPRA